MSLPFSDRTEAGRLLAKALGHLRGRSDLLILALPRGGVPVAFQVAEALQAPLDLMIVRKLGMPSQPELAMGAIASGGGRVMNQDIVAGLGIRTETIETIPETLWPDVGSGFADRRRPCHRHPSVGRTQRHRATPPRDRGSRHLHPDSE